MSCQGGRKSSHVDPRYTAVAAAWRAIWMPTLCSILTHPRRETRNRSSFYLLPTVLKLDPLCVGAILLQLRHPDAVSAQQSDDGLTPSDRRLAAVVHVRRCAVTTVCIGLCDASCRDECGGLVVRACVCVPVCVCVCVPQTLQISRLLGYVDARSFTVTAAPMCSADVVNALSWVERDDRLDAALAWDESEGASVGRTPAATTTTLIDGAVVHEPLEGLSLGEFVSALLHTDKDLRLVCTAVALLQTADTWRDEKRLCVALTIGVMR